SSGRVKEQSFDRTHLTIAAKETVFYCPWRVHRNAAREFQRCRARAVELLYFRFQRNARHLKLHRRFGWFVSIFFYRLGTVLNSNLFYRTTRFPLAEYDLIFDRPVSSL